MTATRAHNPRRRAFTLIELICVVLILSVIGGLIVPRITSNDARASEFRAQSIAGLFSAIARKDALANEPMRLKFDREQQTLELLVLRQRDDDRRARWVRDSLVPSVDVTQLTPRTLYLDGIAQRPDEWTIEFPQNQLRPAITLELQHTGESQATRIWIVELLPYETKATLRTAGAEQDAMRNRLVDLDAVGRGDSPW
jgi:prepilin-type N-terminal cleavage/methylation domain-containing protein